METVQCAECGVTITKLEEPSWTGWVDESGDQLSYVPTLHDHYPVRVFRDLDEVKRANRDAGFYFFDVDTLAFFGSRVVDHLHAGRFFVTSEQPPHGARAWTVREARADGSIRTVGEFLQYPTRAAAARAVVEIAATGGRVDCS